jgi:O-succinylbenzoate synthase
MSISTCTERPATGPIRIERLEVFLVDLAMTTPFRVSFGTLTARPTVVVRVATDDGAVGYGEAAALPDPTFNHETPESAFAIIARYLGPAVVGRSFPDVAALRRALDLVRGHPFAKTGVESAAWCALAERQGVSLATLFGGERDRIPVGESIGIKDSLEALLDEVAERLAQGFRRIKVKIEPGWDRRPVEVLRAHYPDVALMVDANSAYTLADRDLFRELDRHRLLMVEQPLAPDDLVDHAALQAAIDTPVCLDESIDSVAQARAALALGSCRVVNVKPGRVGGPLAAFRIHDLCRAAGVPVWMGGMFESGIGRAFNLALASLPGFTLPADMSPSAFYFAHDLVDPPYTVAPDGTIAVPTAPGLGFAVDEDRLRRTAARVEVVTAPRGGAP